MSRKPNWRSSIAADGFERLERPQLAAEFLRRNPAYWRDHARMMRRVAAGVVTEVVAMQGLAARWGLSFRLGACRPWRR